MNACIRGTIATCGFELARSLSAQRIAVMLVLIAFPASMLALILGSSGSEGLKIPFMETLIILLVGLVGILSLLLWASTAVYTELEGKSWVFIACRPCGRVSTILGKYLAAVILSYSICFFAMSMAVLVAQSRGGLEDPKRFWLVTAGLLLLACASYAAIFTLIGTLFYRRAMVFCAAYMLAIEFIVANIPAMIRGFTIRFHLQELTIDGLGWLMPLQEEPYRAIYGDFPIWLDFFALGLVMVLCLGGSCLAVINREYITADET